MDEKQRTDEELQETIENLDVRIARLFRHHLDHEQFINLLRKDICELENARENHDERLSANHKRIGALQRRVEDIDQRLDELDNDSGPGLRIEAIDHGFDGLCSQVKKMAGRIDVLERKMADMSAKDKLKDKLEGGELLGLEAEISRCMNRVRQLEQREDAQVNCNASLQWHITEQKIRIDKIEALLNAIREALQTKEGK